MPAPVNQESTGKKGQWIFFLLIGVLSMLYAELFSGASQIWYLDIWSLLVTFPLYLVHMLFFLALAFSTGKTSPVHLYLWGILFGLYESWITQVLWVGYDSNGPLIGMICGIGAGEFLALVFFWHPIFSFILPLLVFQIMALSVSPSKDRILTSHLPFLVNRNHTWKLLLGAYIIGSLFMAVNYQGQIHLVVGALGGTYALLYGLYWRARKIHADSFSIYTLQVGSSGKKILFLSMIFLYGVFFFGFGITQGRIPGISSVITTLFLYGIFGSVILFSRKSRELPTVPVELLERCITMRDYSKLTLFNCGFAILLCFIFSSFPQFLFGVFMIVYFIMCVLGTYFFIKALFLRNKQSRSSFEASMKHLQNELGLSS